MPQRDEELRRRRLEQSEVKRAEPDVLHEFLEARLEDELAEALHQIEATQEDEHRPEIPAVEYGRVVEEHEHGSDAGRDDDHHLQELEREVCPVFELIGELGPEEEREEPQVPH